MNKLNNNEALQMNTVMPTMKKSLLALAVAGTMAMSGGAYAAAVGTTVTVTDDTTAGTLAGDATAITAPVGVVLTVTDGNATNDISVAANTAVDRTIQTVSQITISDAVAVTSSVGAINLSGTDSITIINDNDAATSTLTIGAVTGTGTLIVSGTAGDVSSAFTVAGSTLGTSSVALAEVEVIGGVGHATDNNAATLTTSSTLNTTLLTITGGVGIDQYTGFAATATITGNATIGSGGIAVLAGAGVGGTDNAGVGGAATLTLSGTTTITGGAVTVTGGAAANSTPGGASALTFTGDVTSDSALTITGGAVTGAGAASVTVTANATFSSIVLNDVIGLTTLTSNAVTANTITGAITAASDGDGAIVVATDDVITKFASNIGLTGTRLKSITITSVADKASSADFDGDVYADAVLLTAHATSGAAAATFAGDLGFTSLTLDKVTEEATVTFDGSTTQTVSGEILAAADGDGLVVINNDVNLTGMIGNDDGYGVGNIRIASGKTLTVTSSTAADGIEVAGKVDADSADTRGGTLSLIAGSAVDDTEATAGTTQISTIDGTTTLTAVNITSGNGGRSDLAGTSGAVGGESTTTFTGAADITTVTIASGNGGVGMANHATDTAGGVGGASTTAFTAALTATTVGVTAGTGGAGGAGTDAITTDNLGGNGGAATLDLNVATGTTQAIGTLTIAGGDGGSAGTTTGIFLGAVGGAGANALATIAGDITGNIVLNDGAAGATVGAVAGGAKGTATVTFDGTTNQTIIGNITAAADGEGAITMTGNSGTADTVTMTGNIGSSSAKVGTLTIGSGTAETSLALTGDVYATTINAGSVGDWTGNVATAIDINGDMTFTTLNVNAGTGATAEDLNMTVSGNLTGTTIALTDATGNGSSTLTLDGTAAQTISAAITASVTGLGNVTVANTAGTVTFSEKVGDSAGNAVETITLNTGTTSVFNKAVDSTAITATTTASSTFNAAVTNTNAITTGVGSTTVFDSTVSSATLSNSGAMTLKGAVTLTGVLTTGNGSTITLGTAFKDGGATAITAADSTDGINQTGGAVTVNVSNQFTTGTVVLLENTLALDANDLAAFTVTDTALVDYTLASATGTAALSQITITAAKRTTAGIATYLGMSTAQSAALGQISAAVASGDATASTALDTVLVTGGSTAVNAAEQLNSDAGAAMGAAMAVTGGVNNVIAGRQANTKIAFNTLGKQSGVSTGDASNDAVVWAQVFTSDATQDKVNNIDGYDADSQGLVVGWEAEKAGSTFGLSLSFADTDVDGKSAAAAHIDTSSVQGTIYGSNGSADWMMGYASADNDTTRTINFGGLTTRTATGNYASNILMAKAGYSFDSIEMAGGVATLTPKADLSWTHINNDGYTETGASNLNLIVDSTSNDVVTARAGMEFAQRIESNGAVTIPHVSIMGGYDLNNDRAETTSTFTGGGSSFTTQGIDPSNASLELGVGVDHVSDDTTVSFNFNTNLKDGYNSDTASLTLKSKF